MATSISRDPFARGNVIRETVYLLSPAAVAAGCTWCGQVKRTRANGDAYLYRYGWSPDAGRQGWADGLFCSRGCSRDYSA